MSSLTMFCDKSLLRQTDYTFLNIGQQYFNQNSDHISVDIKIVDNCNILPVHDFSTASLTVFYYESFS